MAVDALGAYQAKNLVHEGRVVNWDGKVDVTSMTGAGLLAKIACGTAVRPQRVSLHLDAKARGSGRRAGIRMGHVH